MNIKKYALLTAVAFALTACGSDDPSTGSLSISLTDAPVDGATAVVVQFSGVELQGPSGRVDFDFDELQTIDLLALQGSKSEILMSESGLEAGNYQWMRLKVNALENTIDSYIEFDDGMEQYSMYVPSGAQSGLKLNRPFTIAAGSRTDFTIDFDLRKSVHLPSNANADYKLRPTLRVIDNLEVGTITGTVNQTILTDADICTGVPAVYLFDGTDLDPNDVDQMDDIDGLNAEPVTSANVDTTTGEYEIGFVQAGLDYTVALTCTADLDDPEVDNANPTSDPVISDLTFIDQQNVSITANTTTVADF